MTATLHIGDVRDVMATMPDGSVDLLCTSPPFLALRSYLPADHPDKHREIGSEANPAAFLDTLLDLTQEWRRLLSPYGSICVELGDTYAGSGGGGGDYLPGGLREGQPGFAGSGQTAREGNAAHWRQKNAWRGNTDANCEPIGGRASRAGRNTGWPPDKSLCGIPTLYTWSLAYGFNLLNPDHRFAPWRIRNLLVWARPNPPVGALGDKFRPATSYVTVATVARDRWFDLDAVRTDGRRDVGSFPGREHYPGEKGPRANGTAAISDTNPAGAPPLDWYEEQWQPLIDLPTHPYKGAHYATFPPELPRRLIEAMCPRQVCTTCGEPRRRIVGEAEYVTKNGKPAPREKNGTRLGSGVNQFESKGDIGTFRIAPTLGWTDCNCPVPSGSSGMRDNREGGLPVTAPPTKYRSGVVLDPFAGSGTTLAVAVGCGRDAIGIELDAANEHLIRERVGMFLEVA